MKNTKQCPKCDSGEILIMPSRAWGSADSNSIPLQSWITTRHLGPARHICTGCGYTEEWIESSADLEALRKKLQSL